MTRHVSPWAITGVLVGRAAILQGQPTQGVFAIVVALGCATLELVM